MEHMSNVPHKWRVQVRLSKTFVPLFFKKRNPELAPKQSNKIANIIAKQRKTKRIRNGTKNSDKKRNSPAKNDVSKKKQEKSYKPDSEITDSGDLKCVVQIKRLSEEEIRNAMAMPSTSANAITEPPPAKRAKRKSTNSMEKPAKGQAKGRKRMEKRKSARLSTTKLPQFVVTRFHK